VKHTWRLIDGGGHSWGNRFQDETLPYSFAFVGGMFAGKDRAGAADGKGSRGPEKPGGGEQR
jgi:hypothetical protein